MAKRRDRDRDEERGFGPEDGRGRFSGRYTREQDEETGGRQYPRDDRGPKGGRHVSRRHRD